MTDQKDYIAHLEDLKKFVADKPASLSDSKGKKEINEHRRHLCRIVKDAIIPELAAEKDQSKFRELIDVMRQIKDAIDNPYERQIQTRFSNNKAIRTLRNQKLVAGLMLFTATLVLGIAISSACLMMPALPVLAIAGLALTAGLFALVGKRALQKTNAHSFFQFMKAVDTGIENKPASPKDSRPGSPV